jgi:tRNA pseudouridine55 synthase
MASHAGILLVDKPEGLTSHDVVQRVRRLLAPGVRNKQRVRAGHAGTLDPLATGLLLVLVGPATRLAPWLSGLDKTYEATVRLGTATTTLDREGEVTTTAPVPGSPAGLAAAVAGLTGEIAQVPPIYSALKRDGQPLHRLARRGAPVAEPPPRPVTIHALDVVATRWPEVDLRVDCSSGTYVRSLARDLALALGTVGHLQALRRTRVGPFALAQARPLAAYEEDPAGAVAALVPPGAALPHLPAGVIDAAAAAEVRRSGRLDRSWLDDDVARATHACLLDPRGGLVAVTRQDETGQPALAAVFAPREEEEDHPCA